MIELLVLGDFISTYNIRRKKDYIEGKMCDGQKICERYCTLAKEFISPYVIDKNSKE